ncbi:ABC transporter ATP-binding protein/permease [Maridesulfovibrio frigidus]|uniref:ABC transporter ATP-binding protein/permease n=1 Tax=Maridesulfovibrio frigidus TaxID=340956 RepID=UPI0004E17067|nr:ABC transporter ATP-binding protein [Maridesulfovibrio frigidus]
MIKKLLTILSPKDRKKFILLMLFTIFVSCIETVGISAVMPFIAVASDPALIETNKYYHYVYTFLGFQSPKDFIVTFGLTFIGFFIFKSIVNLTSFYLMSRFSQGRAHSIAKRLFSNYLFMSYQRFVGMNSASLSKSLVSETQNMGNMFMAVLLLCSEFFVLIFLYGVLLAVDVKITIALTAFLGVMVLILFKTITKTITVQGRKRVDHQEKYFRIAGESFGNMKVIKLMSSESMTLDNFLKSSKGFVWANIVTASLSHVPRYSLETLGFSTLISIVVYVVYSSNNVAAVLPIVTMYALALYRLLPSVNRIVSSYNNIMYYKKTLDIVYDDFTIQTHPLGESPLTFDKTIELENVSFNYGEATPVLEKVNLTIKSGDKVALIGDSGSGKSTLADVIIGMYPEYSGNISIDGTKLNTENLKSWRSYIGYIPQNIYLFDATVAENVAFGRPVDIEKIKKALVQADILDFLNKKEGLDTMVGDGGIMLSGGQKQRIAIARALYGNPKLLVLDEATSALDSDTESRIMDKIYDLSGDRTLLIIAHRLSTIERCDKVYKIQNQNIILTNSNI